MKLGLLLLVLISSCKVEQWEDGGVLDFNSSLETNLSQEERIIATRICYAYQSKRKTKLEADVTYEATISTSRKLCNGNEEEEKDILAYLRLISLSAGAIFDVSPSKTIYLKEIETDEHGQLSSTCQQIFKGEIRIKRDSKIQFLKTGVYDTYKVLREVGEETVLEEYKVDVSREPLYGVMKEFSQTVECPGGSQVSRAVSKQTFESISN